MGLEIPPTDLAIRWLRENSLMTIPVLVVRLPIHGDAPYGAHTGVLETALEKLMPWLSGREPLCAVFVDFRIRPVELLHQ